MKYNILCKRWGGRFGYGEDLLKENGEIIAFDSLQEAKQQAEKIQNKMNGGYGSAQYSYTPLEEGTY